MITFKIVNGCNYDSEYPMEEFVTGLPVLFDKAKAEMIADAINDANYNSTYAARFYRVVPEDYVLKNTGPNE